MYCTGPGGFWIMSPEGRHLGTVREAFQTVGASLADSSLARLLSCRIGAPLLSVDRIVYADNGLPVERVRTHYRSDLFNFTMHLGGTAGTAKQAFGNRYKEAAAIKAAAHNAHRQEKTK